MLVEFSVTNWRSFKDKATLSMIASRERQHSNHLTKVQMGRNRLNITPLAMIYGANASGKSNLFKALSFVRKFIIMGTFLPEARIPVEPFRLARDSHTKPSVFSLQILIDESVYEFSFSVSSDKVLSESLTVHKGSKSEVYYTRQEQDVNILEIFVEKERALCRESGKKQPEGSFFDYLRSSVRANQLLLTTAVQQNVLALRPLYRWINDSLILLSPNSRYAPFYDPYNDHSEYGYEGFKKLLTQLDTGICDVRYKEIPFDQLPFTPEEQDRLTAEVLSLPQGKKRLADIFSVTNGMERYILQGKEGKVVAQKMMMFHSGASGMIPFDRREESDGTQRLMDIIPAFLKAANPKADQVVFIDELDRSLHPTLVRSLLEFFLDGCSGKRRAQLLLTTHDVYQIDQNLLRRDELWLTERGNGGASTLIPFSDYELRDDLDLRKFYLSGRLGGIPRVSLPKSENDEDQS